MIISAAGNWYDTTLYDYIKSISGYIFITAEPIPFYFCKNHLVLSLIIVLINSPGTRREDCEHSENTAAFDWLLVGQFNYPRHESKERYLSKYLFMLFIAFTSLALPFRATLLNAIEAYLRHTHELDRTFVIELGILPRLVSVLLHEGKVMATLRGGWNRTRSIFKQVSLL